MYHLTFGPQAKDLLCNISPISLNGVAPKDTHVSLYRSASHRHYLLRALLALAPMPQSQEFGNVMYQFAFARPHSRGKSERSTDYIIIIIIVGTIFLPLVDGFQTEYECSNLGCYVCLFPRRPIVLIIVVVACCAPVPFHRAVRVDVVLLLRDGTLPEQMMQCNSKIDIARRVSRRSRLDHRSFSQCISPLPPIRIMRSSKPSHEDIILRTCLPRHHPRQNDVAIPNLVMIISNSVIVIIT
mmetsp:Transcript_10113/g.18149  ORF Transcript_10113/g.18149 Transcript_10113/m.18149 type:complete len:241 (-) Transcript_10113:424-1146(-)